MNTQIPVLIKYLSEEAYVPTKNWGDAGYDLYSVEDYVLKPLERKLFKTDVSMSIPVDYFGRIVDRSGNALKKGLHVVAGVVDSIYRGEVGVVLVNLNQLHFHDLGKQNIEIKKGDRIAQIIFERYSEANFVEVDQLDESPRGQKGFGSSGS